MKSIKYIILALIVGVLSSCETYPDQEQEHTAIGKLSGEWLSNVYEANGTTLVNTTVYPLRTYNTTSNDANKAWIRLGTTQTFALLGKIDVNVGQLSFAGSAVPNEAKAANTFTIVEGNVTLNSVTTESGVKADGIYIKYTTTVDGKTYVIKGHRRTQWGDAE